jgi:hypothetical protein
MNSNSRSMTQSTDPAGPVPEEPSAPRGAYAARTAARARDYSPPYEQPARAPASEREEAFNFVAWLADGATGILEELRHNDLGLTEEFWQHAYAARRESLLALRAFLDTVIEKTDGAAKEEAERQQRRQRRGGINIE